MLVKDLVGIPVFSLEDVRTFLPLKISIQKGQLHLNLLRTKSQKKIISDLNYFCRDCFCFIHSCLWSYGKVCFFML